MSQGNHHQQVEQLHQQASEQYLQGNFREALATWQQLLELNSSDERAREGVRLCGLLTEGPAQSAPAQPPEAPGPPAQASVPSLESPPAERPEGTTVADPSPVAEGPAAISPAGELDFELKVTESGQIPAVTPEVPADDSLPSGIDPQSFIPSPSSHGDGPVPQELPDPERQNEGLDLGDDASQETIPLAASVPVDEPRRGIAQDAVPEGQGQHAPAGAAVEQPEPPQAAGLHSPPGGAGKQAAAAELERRVEELLAEARAAVEQESKDDALSILARILILDEQNEQALEMQRELQGEAQAVAQQIEDWITEGVQQFEQGDYEDARDLFVKVTELLPTHAEAEHYLDQIESRLKQDAEAAAEQEPPADAQPAQPEIQQPTTSVSSEPEVGVSAAAAADSGSADEPDTGTVPLARSPGPEEETPLPEPEPRKREAVAPRVAPRARKVHPLLLIAAVALVVAAGGWLLVQQYGGLDQIPFLGFLGGDEVAQAEPNVTEPAGPPEPRGQAAAAQPATMSQPAEAEPVPPTREQQINQAIRQARTAYQNGDYASAVQAYHKVLDLDPQHEEASEGLTEAGKRYKAQQAVEEQLDFARSAFADKDYASALRRLYRLPDSVDQRMVQRWLVNGWYNMGLTQLKAGDCDKALEQLSEAVAIDGSDQSVGLARSLARQYKGRTKDSSYYRTVEALQFRKFDD